MPRKNLDALVELLDRRSRVLQDLADLRKSDPVFFGEIVDSLCLVEGAMPPPRRTRTRQARPDPNWERIRGILEERGDWVETSILRETLGLSNSQIRHVVKKHKAEIQSRKNPQHGRKVDLRLQRKGGDAA